MKIKPIKYKKILPTITTISRGLWRNKIEEAKKLRLKEVFVFLTAINKKERKEFYKLLEKTEIEKIPFVHIRTDMELSELDYLVKNYKTEVFNIHTEEQYPFGYDCSKYKKIISIENQTAFRLKEKEIKNYAGICLDFTHLENVRLTDKKAYQHDIKVIEKYPIKCNHISAIKKYPYSKKNKVKYDSHHLEDLSELDYLKRYPANYFSSFIAIELENSIQEQLKIRDYIFDLLKNK